MSCTKKGTPEMKRLHFKSRLRRLRPAEVSTDEDGREFGLFVFGADVVWFPPWWPLLTLLWPLLH